MPSLNDHDYKAFFEKCKCFIEQQVTSKLNVSDIDETESILEAYFLLAYQVYKLKPIFNMMTFHYDLFPQVWVDQHGNAVLSATEEQMKYRLDFALLNYGEYINYQVDSKKLYLKIGIEVDGHDFHEKTREQVRRDKERERFLVIHGWHMLHFSGSEVFRDPFYCIEELDRLLLSLMPH